MSLAKRPAKYTGVRPINPPNVIYADRAPASTDTAYVPGDLWLDQTNSASYMYNKGGVWIQTGGAGGAGSFTTLISTGATTLATASGAAANTFGAGQTSGTLGIGGTGAATGAITIAGGTGAQTLNIANSTGGKTVAIATGAGANAVTIGSTNTTSATTINSGSGGIALVGAVTAPSIALNGGSVLNAYVENTAFTPGLAFGGSATGITYGTQTGYYMKIGKMVFFWATIVLTSKGAQTGAATVTGLPFTSLDASGPVDWFVNVQYTTVTLTAAHVGQAYIANNSTSVSLIESDGSTATDLDNTVFADTSAVVLTGFYWATT